VLFLLRKSQFVYYNLFVVIVPPQMLLLAAEMTVSQQV